MIIRTYFTYIYERHTFYFISTLNPFVKKSVFRQRKSIALAVSRTEIDYPLIPAFRYFRSPFFNCPNRILCHSRYRFYVTEKNKKSTLPANCVVA